jgi:MFS transporter, DHA1 family, multidrug resistance protein
VFGAVAAAIAVASLVNSRLVATVGMRRLSHAALIGFAAAGIAHTVIAVGLGQPPLAAFVGIMAVQLFCFGLIMPNFNALCMEPMGRIAGTASSFVGAVTTGLAAALGWYVGQLYDGSVVPLVTGFAVFGAIGLGIVLVTERGRLFGTGR